MRISDWSSDVCSSDLILVALPDAATPEQIATAKSKIEGVKDLIDKGEMDFTAAAIRYSDAPDRKRVVLGKSVSVRVDLGGRCIIKKKILKYYSIIFFLFHYCFYYSLFIFFFFF